MQHRQLRRRRRAGPPDAAAGNALEGRRDGPRFVDPRPAARRGRQTEVWMSPLGLLVCHLTRTMTSCGGQRCRCLLRKRSSIDEAFNSFRYRPNHQQIHFFLKIGASVIGTVEDTIVYRVCDGLRVYYLCGGGNSSLRIFITSVSEGILFPVSVCLTVCLLRLYINPLINGSS